MNKLTVIIPFLNEGNEVENTVKSIRETAGNNVNILLINDCSTDGYDYESILQKYCTKYIANKERMGVARSRELGVSSIDTPYFILLDAHMRFYVDYWWHSLIEHLQNNDRAVYCFACQAIDNAGKFLNGEMGTGAKISLYGNEFTQILEPIWIKSKELNSDTYEIPCILGATYGMSKRYWNYLKGLSMLKYYGADETYLSLKVWLEGGKCLLIKNILAGHIFRAGTPPYELFWPHSVFNKLVISETLLPEDYNRYVHAQLCSLNPNAYAFALADLIKTKTDIDALRTYYRSICTKDFATFTRINSLYNRQEETIPSVQPGSQDDIQKVLKKTYDHLHNNHTQTIGLGVGGLGELIFMLEYANLYDQNEIPEIRKALEKLLTTSSIKNYDFKCGVSGLAIGLKYFDRIFHEFDINEQFRDLDDRLYNIINENIKNQDYSALTGACGIALYFLERESSPKLDDSINVLLKYINAYVFQNKDNLSQTILLEITYFLIKAHQKGFETYDTFHQIGNILSASKSTDFILICASAYCLLEIGEILKNDFVKIGYNILIEMSLKREAVILNIPGIGLLNGTSMLTFIFDSMNKKFDEKVFNEAHTYWKYETLIGIISMLETTSSLNEIQKSFIYGISGAAFTCIKY